MDGSARQLVIPDGELIKRLREDRGMKQRRLAASAAISPRTLQRIEDGLGTEMAGVARIAEVLGGVDPDSLILHGASHKAFSKYLSLFDAFIKDRLRADYTGRKFVFDDFDKFRKSTESGYYLVVGDPGIGKSALIAQAIKLYNLQIFHFNMAASGIDTPQQFLESICAQLIEVYHLPHMAPPEGFDQNGAFLGKVLNEVSVQLREDKLIIPVDAIDEVRRVGVPGRANSLFLPAALPKGVYFLLTARRREDLQLHAGVTVYPLDALVEKNLDEVRAFIRAKAEKDLGIANWCNGRHRPLNVEEFISLLTEKSQGNFQYLRHVLPAIAGGKFKDFTPDQLPEGLRNYYRAHWHQMKAEAGPNFERMFVPVLCSLAAEYEPVTVDLLARSTGLQPHEILSVMRAWSEFVYHDPPGTAQRRWRIYHRSFHDFLREEIDPDLRTAHGVAAASILAKIHRRKPRARG